MTGNDFINALQKNDAVVIRSLFENYFSYMSGVAVRFSKNDVQAKELLMSCFSACINGFISTRDKTEQDFEIYLKKQFIIEAVRFIRSIRSEYYVASTVYADTDRVKNYSLFDNNEIIDFSGIETPLLVKSVQELVPSQRLVFNLFVVEGMDITSISEMLEASEQTVKSNLEKSRYNLQKNIEKNIKLTKNEQAL